MGETKFAVNNKLPVSAIERIKWSEILNKVTNEPDWAKKREILQIAAAIKLNQFLPMGQHNQSRSGISNP